MSIEFKAGRYFDQLFFVEAYVMNVMGAIFKDANGPWTFIFRYRIIVDDDLSPNSKDIKRWYERVYKDGENEINCARKDMHEVVTTFIEMMRQKLIEEGIQRIPFVQYVPMETADTNECMRIISSQPWANLSSTEHSSPPH